ncbi:hypothetical protein BDF21DRAFT_344344 [Thamnidium elegans]|nr:hypothetical protein BDF21DRAFT_344344 [Thamnidium elegans]
MTSDEEIKVVIQSLQDQIKYGQEVNNEKIAAIQLDNSNYSHTQSRLETQLYAQEQELNKFKKEIQHLTKSKKDVEKKLITESEEYENERSNWQQREADLYNQMRSLSVNNEPRTPRTPRRRSVTANTLGIMTFTSGLGDIGETETTKLSDQESDDHHHPRPTPKLAVIDSSYAREAKIAQRTIKAQDKLILDLKNDVDKQKALLQERQSESQLVSLKVVHLEHEISNVKQLNRSLMEDNESYQILLHEKTINGEFIMNPIMQVENPTVQESTSNTTTGGLNLADELASSGLNLADELASSDRNNQIQKLTDEVKMLQDTNRALQLYMNKILMRIINNKQLEDVLSIDQPTKPKEHVNTNDKTLTSSSSAAGPTPTKTVSTTNNTLNNNTNTTTTTATNRQRRRTISYWGSKVPPPPPAKSNSEREIETVEDRRRHSSIVTAAPQPERSVSTSTTSAANGGWAKALRRMSVIGWSTVKEETTAQNDSAVGSSLSEEEETCRKSSGSSTPSVRRSNELGTLAEE